MLTRRQRYRKCKIRDRGAGGGGGGGSKQSSGTGGSGSSYSGASPPPRLVDGESTITSTTSPPPLSLDEIGAEQDSLSPRSSCSSCSDSLPESPSSISASLPSPQRLTRPGAGNWWAVLGHSTFPSALSIWSPSPLPSATNNTATTVVHQPHHHHSHSASKVEKGGQHHHPQHHHHHCSAKEGRELNVGGEVDEDEEDEETRIGGSAYQHHPYRRFQHGAGLMDPGHESPLNKCYGSNGQESGTSSPIRRPSTTAQQPASPTTSTSSPITFSPTRSILKKEVNFSDTDRIVLIPARCDYDEETRNQLWWSLEDYEYFKKCTLEDFKRGVRNFADIPSDDEEEEEEVHYVEEEEEEGEEVTATAFLGGRVVVEGVDLAALQQVADTAAAIEELEIGVHHQEQEVEVREDEQARERLMATKRAIAATAAAQGAHRGQVRVVACNAAALGAQRVQKGLCAQEVAALRAQMGMSSSSLPIMSMSPTSDDGILYGGRRHLHHAEGEEEEKKLFSYLSHDLSHLSQVSHTGHQHHHHQGGAGEEGEEQQSTSNLHPANKRDSLTLGLANMAKAAQAALVGIPLITTTTTATSTAGAAAAAAPFCTIDVQGQLKCSTAAALYQRQGSSGSYSNLIDSLDLASLTTSAAALDLLQQQQGEICHRGPDVINRCVRSVHLQAEELMEISTSAAVAAVAGNRHHHQVVEGVQIPPNIEAM